MRVKERRLYTYMNYKKRREMMGEERETKKKGKREWRKSKKSIKGRT